jgi:type II secretory pathway component PulC
MFRYRRKAMKYKIMFFFTLIACLLSFGITSFISARNASADSELPKEKLASQESVYTIQTGSFKDNQRAEKQFRIIEQSLEGTALKSLRIEKIGRFYAVRVGRFASLTEAKQFLREHELSLEGAMVMKAYFIDERILLIYDKVEEDVPEGKAGKQRDRYLPDIPYALNDLGLKLVGTALMDEPGSSIAIIEDLASGDQEIYKKGDTLKGVLVKRILSRGVIIAEGKGNEILIMVGGKNTRTFQSESRRVQLGEKVVDATVPTYSAMMRGIRIRPYRQGGRPVGFAIYNIKSKSIFARGGLENCDVITAVNGKPIEVTQEPANLYKAFKQGGEVTIDIKRDDINQKLSFEIK